MKTKLTVLFLLLMTFIIFIYYKVNYKDFDEAISESNVQVDEVFHTIDFDDYKIIFYGDGDVLSVASIEKTLLGYRWVFGAGSKLFNEEDRMLTRAFSNIESTNQKSNKELISLTFGVINDPLIESLEIKYKDKDFAEATIIETSKGRIWYCFSKLPINYDPEVKVNYMDGTEKNGWH
ncbi:hypothetical protein QTL97_14770 [Sporosarcina thermotolerans]|uniref:Uncharacterized protein n=1 Tax=Sporosarcina thermotolerans TaxID=633404 RepID=A0AAW9AC88_9BACL|nr:hypothetical protein [Sporosarcina thermotolerans]MDW0118193.1 hypothetical protein [Sporosarcina thermotolerans]WHT47674.1 hypothetical protein QNH10_16315 [Sporosarcina thermotolerans]